MLKVFGVILIGFALISVFGKIHTDRIMRETLSDPTKLEAACGSFNKEHVRWALLNNKPVPDTTVIVNFGYAGMSQVEACSGAYRSTYKYPMGTPVR